MKVLLLHSADDLRLKEDSCGSIPLFCAIEAGNNNVCKELLSARAEQQVATRYNTLTGITLALELETKPSPG